MKYILYYLFPKEYCKRFNHTPGYMRIAGHEEPVCYVCSTSILYIPKTDPWYIKWTTEIYNAWQKDYEAKEYMKKHACKCCGKLHS